MWAIRISAIARRGLRNGILTGGLIAALAAGGCESLGGGNKTLRGPNVTAASHPTLEDFPLPSGFALVSDNSRSVVSGATRWVEYEFSGSTGWSQIIRFFMDTLPSAGWTLRTRQLRDGGLYEMRFESTREECDVRVKRVRGKTVLNIEIRPQPQGSADRLPRPVQTP